MRRTIAIALLIACHARPPTAAGQYLPPPGGYESRDGPRERRASRERAIMRAGSESRQFVELYGEDAVNAISACSYTGCGTLVEFHRSGGLGKLSQPRRLLRTIAKPKHGDEVLAWAVEHQAELVDPDALEAFLDTPLEYILDLKPLAAGTEEAYLRRTRPPPPPPPPSPRIAPVQVLGCFALVGLATWWLWRQARK